MDRSNTDSIRPFLQVKRFCVLKSGGFVYDQPFKLGVNIIRGDNGTGKSTIMDLLYFALGAELSDWTDEQERCDETLVEVLINYKPFTFRREIVSSGKSAMYLFEGTIDAALASGSNWFRFPYARSSDTHSYSQEIFNLLGLPSHKTDESKNLTMHQILRLMYVDQLSETTKLLKEDKKYDNASMRRAIGEYLLGIDDLEAHNLRQELIKASAEFDSVNSELKAIYRFVGFDNSILRSDQIDSEIGQLESQIEDLENNRKEIRMQSAEALNENIKGRVIEINGRLEELSSKEYELKEEKEEISTELVDTSLYIKSLQFRMKSLEQSRLANSEIGELIFKYCPACLTPIQEHVDEGHCALCKSDLASTERHYSYIQMSNEINFQIKESEKLIELFHEKLSSLNTKLGSIRREIVILKKEYLSLTSTADNADAALSQIGIEIGYRRSQIVSLHEKREMVEQIVALVDKKKEINETIGDLTERLEQIENANKDRYLEVYSNIEEIAASIIREDGGYESVFEDVEEVTLDFGKDKMYVNGRSKFSASSMTVMKNAIRIAIFIHCVGDSQARLPRFLMLDNVEDKGMTEERSQNFQRVIVAACDQLTDDYQLIFTTSMIDPALDKTDYVVGPFYKKGDHTLKFSSA
ncbi:AAA family ATPase [Halomonas casei]|uniref:AAA family ATPase n=1 Tax=Halomonas TaxID=2745 RepID=UPI0018688B11|nr:AAA family ATPase [Halomonas casei]